MHLSRKAGGVTSAAEIVEKDMLPPGIHSVKMTILPKCRQPSGSKYNSLMRVTSETSDPFNSLTA